MEYLVTGGAGFIGSNIVRQLVETNKSVRVLDNIETGRIVNIDDIRDRIQFMKGDIRDADTVKEAVRDVRNVLHLAALPSVARSVEDPVTSNRVNVSGTLTMLMESRDAGVERFVFSSSSSVYGDTPTLPKREDMTPMPLSPYAVQKLAGESYCRIFFNLYGLKTYSLRYFNVFGPRQNPKSQYSAVIPLFVDSLRSDRPPVIHGDGKQTRDFTYVDDVVSANLLCCRAPDEAAGGVYNVACGSRISVNELASKLVAMMAKNIEPVHSERRPGDVRDSQADASLAREKLGWEPRTPFDEGLGKTVAFFCP